ncbi:hypothetical protein QYE76_036836 [Lolium multiflorum]|uniref:Uncharacterized protein n=1 Tax=Lolium multiflorum TaxID=4521 RepID=A0AAD8R1R4_LOLMU|nr:hypothetical protein QYE76_036836 [Lolium multiflorum]
MGRSPCCEKAHTNKRAWTKEEDQRLIGYIKAHGEGCWRSLPKAAGLLRCGKSCRLRWMNYLRPISAGMDPHTHRPISVCAAAASGLTTASNTASSFPSSPAAPASRPANALYAARPAPSASRGRRRRTTGTAAAAGATTGRAARQRRQHLPCVLAASACLSLPRTQYVEDLAGGVERRGAAVRRLARTACRVRVVARGVVAVQGGGGAGHSGG